MAAKLGLTQAELELAWPRLDAIPFESEHQYMATLHQHSDDRVIYLKGAVEAVLKRSSQERYPQGDRPIDPAQIEQAAAAMAARGLRVLAFASNLPRNWSGWDLKRWSRIWCLWDCRG